MQGADNRRDEANLTIDPERSEDMEVSAERTSDQYLGRCCAGVPYAPAGKNKLLSEATFEIESFDGLLPSSRLGELSAMDQQRFFRLNSVPDRPCSARFNLTDNSVHSRELMEQIVSMGIQRNQVYPTISHRTG